MFPLQYMQHIIQQEIVTTKNRIPQNEYKTHTNTKRQSEYTYFAQQQINDSFGSQLKVFDQFKPIWRLKA